jgi:hypothetical protein
MEVLRKNQTDVNSYVQSTVGKISTIKLPTHPVRIHVEHVASQVATVSYHSLKLMFLAIYLIIKFFINQMHSPSEPEHCPDASKH